MSLKISGAILALTIFLSGCQAQNSAPKDPQSQPGSKQMQIEQTFPDTLASQSQADEQYKQKLLNEPAAKACLDEKDSGKSFICFEKYLQSQVEKESPATAFQDLKVFYPESPLVQSFCHPLVHSIGHAAVKKYPTLAEAYKHGDGFCWSGYYHGVMEEITAKIGRKNLPSKMNEICSTVPGKENYSFDYYNCVHGLGHGTMAITQDQLFTALTLCDNLEGAWEKDSCYGGVFMENIVIDGLNHHTDYLKPNEPLYPCTAVEKQYKKACYLMQTSYVLKVHHYDFKKGFEVCETADEGFKNTCYRSLGRDASGSSVSNIEKTRQTCLLGKDFDQKSECVIGAAKDFVSYFHSDKQAKELCESLEEQELSDVCLKTVEEYYKAF
jgi:hypothetical protein